MRVFGSVGCGYAMHTNAMELIGIQVDATMMRLLNDFRQIYDDIDDELMRHKIIVFAVLNAIAPT